MGIFRGDNKNSVESKARTFRQIDDRTAIGNFDKQIAYDNDRQEWVRWSDENGDWERVGDTDPDNPDYYRDNREPPKAITPDLPTQADAMQKGIERAKDLLRRQGRSATISRQRFMDRLPKNAAPKGEKPDAKTDAAPDAGVKVESAATVLQTGGVKRLAGSSGADVTADTTGIVGTLRGTT